MDKNIDEDNILENADVIKSSTESEIFESWTLLTTEGSRKANAECVVAENVQNLKKYDTKNHELETMDSDISDGISIISDSESAGRISPQSNQLTETVPYKPLTPPNTPESPGIYSNVPTVSQRNEILLERSTVKVSRSMFGLSLPAIFYFSLLTIALISFVDKLNTQWDDNSLSSQLSLLLRKIEDLERQTIFLQKQINCLGEESTTFENNMDKTTKLEDEEMKSKESTNEYVNDYPNEKHFHSGNCYEAKEKAKMRPKPRKTFDAKMEMKDVPKEAYVKRKEYAKTTKFGMEMNSNSNEYQVKTKLNDKLRKTEMKNEYLKKDHARDDGEKTINESERKNENEKQNSKRKYQKYKNPDKKGDSSEDWHENLMKHREESRKNKDVGLTENWYIERANGREAARTI